jgi:hypothetical protein
MVSEKSFPRDETTVVAIMNKNRAPMKRNRFASLLWFRFPRMLVALVMYRTIPLFVIDPRLQNNNQKVNRFYPIDNPHTFSLSENSLM